MGTRVVWQIPKGGPSRLLCLTDLALSSAFATCTWNFYPPNLPMTLPPRLLHQDKTTGAFDKML
jgi:hypothetical protein